MRSSSSLYTSGSEKMRRSSTPVAGSNQRVRSVAIIVAAIVESPHLRAMEAYASRAPLATPHCTLDRYREPGARGILHRLSNNQSEKADAPHALTSTHHRAAVSSPRAWIFATRDTTGGFAQGRSLIHGKDRTNVQGLDAELPATGAGAERRAECRDHPAG